jgi:hypothetical protein
MAISRSREIMEFMEVGLVLFVPVAVELTGEDEES